MVLLGLKKTRGGIWSGYHLTGRNVGGEAQKGICRAKGGAKTETGDLANQLSSLDRDIGAAPRVTAYRPEYIGIGFGYFD